VKKIILIVIIAMAFLVASGMAQPTTVTQSVTQNADGFSAATTQTAQNSATATSPGAVAVVTQTQTITQNAGTGAAGTATVTQNGQNTQPGTATGAAGSTITAAVIQNAVTTAGGAINQRARNNDASLVSGSANQLITQAVTQTATAGPATNINQGGIGGGANPAYNSARNLGANAVVQQVITQTADGGNNVGQAANNRGPAGANQADAFTQHIYVNTGARADGAVGQTITQNAGQANPASGGVTQIGENTARPIGSGSATTQTVTQAGTTVGTGVGAGVAQTGQNFASPDTGANINNNQNTQQAVTQTGTAAGGAAANVVTQRGYNGAVSIGANNVIGQSLTATATGTTVRQGIPPVGGLDSMRNYVRVSARGGAPSATVTQNTVLNAFGTGAGGTAFQDASNSAGPNWAPGATGTLAQMIAMNANPGFTAITQNGINE